MSTFDIKLGPTLYAVPRFNLKQIKAVAHLSQSDTAPADVPFIVLLMALERATPPILDMEALEAIEPEYDGEWQAALDTVMVHAGLRKPKVAPGEAPAP